MRGYRRNENLLATSILSPGAEKWAHRILLLPFDVRWKALVKDDARFYNLAIEWIDMTENQFREPTDEERKQFGLPADTGT